MRFTKIVATIGPATCSEKNIQKLGDMGVSICRLNFSHGSYEVHGATIDTIRLVNKKGYSLGVMLDTKGPEVRTGDVEKPIVIKAGDEVLFTSNPTGNEKKTTIKVDYDLLKQALLNIVINGCQVMPDGGRLYLRTARDNGNVVMTITDEGPGIPNDIRDKIFNLYFTTKPSGNGIGLAQAFRAVQLHNGQIQIISPPDQGASFQITLPIG